MSGRAVAVVCDASPIMNLAAVGRLGLLRELAGTVVVPEAVRREIVRDRDLPGAREIEAEEWIGVERVRDRERVTLLSLELDAGEAETIALALQLRSAGRDPRVVMDERLGRAVCDRLGIARTGVVGVLIAAKRRGLLAGIGPRARGTQGARFPPERPRRRAGAPCGRRVALLMLAPPMAACIVPESVVRGIEGPPRPRRRTRRLPHGRACISVRSLNTARRYRRAV